MDEMQDVLTVAQVATILQLSEATIVRYIKAGELKAVKLGKGFRVRRSDLNAFMEARLTGTQYSGALCLGT